MENTIAGSSKKSAKSLARSGTQLSVQDAVQASSTKTGTQSFTKEEAAKFTLTLLTLLASEVDPYKWKHCSAQAKKLLESNGSKNFDEIMQFMTNNFFGPARAGSLAGMLDRSGFW